jgi:DNA-binding NarL/FixJ family response regulator
MKRTKIVIADDHPVVLLGIRSALEKDGGFEILAETGDGAQVVTLVGRTNPDVVLLDLKMPGMSGLECLERLRVRHPGVKVVIIAAEADPTTIEATFKRGACGYIVKNVDIRDIGPSIRQAVDGTAYHAFGLPAISDEATARDAGLSERELEILRGVARGLSNKAIAGELWVTEQTVKFHLTNVYRKLGLSNRSEATRWVLAKGIQTESPSVALV